MAIFFPFFVAIPTLVGAAEDWSKFLSALRARGYDDVALVYLQRMQEKGETPPDLDDELDYKIGAAAFEESQTSSGAKRETLAKQARAAFEKYLKNSPEGAKALEAKAGLGRLDAERGANLQAQSARKTLSEKDRDDLLLQARAAFSASRENLTEALALAKERCERLQGDATSAPTELRSAQALFLDLNIRVANVEAQNARAFPDGSQERKDGLTSAAKKMADIFSTYRQYSGAFRARFSEAEIRHELGDDAAALKILDELGVLPYSSEFAALKTRALLLYAEIAVDGDPERQMELVRKFTQWTDADDVPKQFYESGEGRRIYLLAGRAALNLERLRRDDYDVFAAAGKKTFVDRDDPAYKTMNVSRGKKSATGNTIVAFALKTLGFAASGRGDDALAAQELLKSDPIFDGIDVSKYSFSQKANNFADAADIASREATSFSQARQAYLDAPSDESKSELATATRAALDAFRVAFEQSGRAFARDKKGRLDAEKIADASLELSNLQMKYAAIAFADERYEEAFAVADRLARLPNFENAGQASRVALRSLQALAATLRAQTDEDRSAEIASLERRADEYANFIAERFKDDADVSLDATYAQLESSLDARDFDAARELLAKIPESSPRRALAEIKLGQSLWNEWSRRRESASEDSEVGGPEADPASLAALLAESAQSLESGLERKLTSGVEDDDAVGVFATYLLAQARAQQGDYRQAEKWLTHPRIGALSVCDRETGETSEAFSFLNDNFKTAVYALVLRAAASDAERFETVKETLGKLDAIASRSPENAAKLSQIYLSLGKSYEERLRDLKTASDAGDAAKGEELRKTTDAFKTLLDEVSARGNDNGYAAQFWVADSYLSLGKGLTSKDGKLSAEALGYFKKALELYREVARRCQTDAKFAPTENAQIGALLKVCECRRYAREYDQALSNLVKILEKAPNNFDAQLEAARLYHDWGSVDPQNYVKAITGDDAGKGGKLIWGWNGMIKRLSSSFEKSDRYKELFFDAYKGKTRSRYQYARSIRDEEERAKQAQSAEEDLKRLYQTRPTLGGPTSFEYFDRAYRSFQKLRGVAKPKGLKEK